MIDGSLYTAASASESPSAVCRIVRKLKLGMPYFLKLAANQSAPSNPWYQPIEW